MVICEDCGAVLDENDLITSKSYVSDYMGGCYETYSVCTCGGDVVEATQCEICGEYFRSDEMHDGICDECLEEEMTVENAIECGKDGSARLDISLNGFLASVFSKEKIDEILTEELEKLINISDCNANYVIDRAEEWCREDASYFAGWLKRNLTHHVQR